MTTNISGGQNATAIAHGIQIEYKSCGDSSSPTVLLTAGLRAQLPCWDIEFCRALAGRGFYVIRYDNRYVGLSTKVEGMASDGLMNKIFTLFMEQETSVPYRIEDMADDGAGLLDAIGISRAIS